MAYKTLMTVDADVTISLGGKNKKTNKENPKQVEGFYLGSKSIEDRKKKSGKSYIHVFLTPKGNLGVWGKTDLDRKLESAVKGQQTRVTFAGMRETPNGPMYTYKVEQDPDQSVDVSALQAAEESSEVNEDNEPANTDEDVDAEYVSEEVETADENDDAEQERALAAAASRRERTAKVQALLAKKK